MADEIHFGQVDQDLAGIDANGVRWDPDLIIEDASPVEESNSQACHGQVMNPPSSAPCPRGPP